MDERLLEEILDYREHRNCFTAAERSKLRKGFRSRLKGDKIKNAFVKLIDDING